MLFKNLTVAALALGTFTLSASQVQAQTRLATERVANGLASPLYVTAPASDPNRLFVVEQGSSGSARIRILDLQTNKLRSTPFLTISGLATGGEQGLLGLAFHPDYANNGKFYVNVTVPGGAFGAGQTQIREYTATSPDTASATPRTLLSFDQPQTNHNGGWLGFSPRAGDSGNLYIATGDGGASNDTGTGHNPSIGNAQDTNSLLGKMLRINVDRDDFANDGARNYGIPMNNPFAANGGRPEIFNTGLRNPFRASFDRKTGDLYIGDVGQSAREELDFQPSTNPGGGENFGWRIREGSIAGPGANDPKPAGLTLTPPILDYPRSGAISGGTIIGGYVYRGTDIPDLDGTYIFADYVAHRIYALRYDGAAVSDLRNITTMLDPPGSLSIDTITSLGEDALGRLYIVDQQGEIFRIIPEPSCIAMLALTATGLLVRRRR